MARPVVSSSATFFSESDVAIRPRCSLTSIDAELTGFSDPEEALFHAFKEVRELLELLLTDE